MKPRDRARFAQALRFALAAHGEQKRKGTQIPYVSHLVQVAGLVLEHGGDADQAIAGLLHDAIEDCEGVIDAQLHERFGPEVARIVRALSDLAEGDTPRRKSPWLLRKRRFIAQLRHQDERVRLVAGCDKLDNLRSTLADLHAEGAGSLERFYASPAQIRWYYEQVRRALGKELPQRLLRELDALIVELARFVPEASPRGARKRRSKEPATR
jgi:(p)ppGpp synthase/HD superfamily hydrolase